MGQPVQGKKMRKIEKHQDLGNYKQVTIHPEACVPIQNQRNKEQVASSYQLTQVPKSEGLSTGGPEGKAELCLAQSHACPASHPYIILALTGHHAW